MDNINCNCNNTGFIKTKDGNIWCDCKIMKIKEEALGKRYIDCTFQNLKLEKHQASAQKIIDEPNNSYYLIGNFGKGKTHISACQFDWLLKEHKTSCIKFFKEGDLIADWQDWENGRFLIVQEFKSLPYLHIFIDDLGRGKITNRVEDDMYSLIDYIYSNNFGLTISSNFTLKEIYDNYGGAITRRLKELCEIIMF